MKGLAFDEPVVFETSESEVIRTVEQAAQLLRSHLQRQFTMVGLNTLLVLERAAEGAEVAEARQAFCLWVSQEVSRLSRLREAPSPAFGTRQLQR